MSFSSQYGSRIKHLYKFGSRGLPYNHATHKHMYKLKDLFSHIKEVQSAGKTLNEVRTQIIRRMHWQGVV